MRKIFSNRQCQIENKKSQFGKSRNRAAKSRECATHHPALFILLANWHAPCISLPWKHAIARQLGTGNVLAEKKDRTSGEDSRGGVGMAEERKDLDKKAQQERKDAHMADPEKNKKAWQQDATDASGRDWTKPFKYDPSQGV